MARFFNTTGFCNPTDHYMVDPLRGLYPGIMQLIRQKNYFLLHAPRQTGKTTLLHALAHRLNETGQYTACVFSVENARYPSISVEDANASFINALYLTSGYFLGASERPPDPAGFSKSPFAFFSYLQAWAAAQQKPVVLLIDEVDSLHDDVLVSLLSQLRNGFQLRPRGFPASIALVGLRDIREYRLKARGPTPDPSPTGRGELGAGSPFNVKAESYFLPSFTKKEVDALLDEHTHDTGQVFSPKVRAKIFEYSGGQPWLTNALAREITSRILLDDYTQKSPPPTSNRPRKTSSSAATRTSTACWINSAKPVCATSSWLSSTARRPISITTTTPFSIAATSAS